MRYTDPAVTDRYARALFDLAKKQGVAAQIVEEAETLSPLKRIGHKLRLFMEAPQITTEQKEQMITCAFGERIHPLLRNFFLLMLRKGRIEYVGAVMRRFRELVELDMGIHEADVETAFDLGDAERQMLQKGLENYLKVRLIIRYTIDPKLIGGVRFTCGDLLVDDSVRGKLDRLRQQLESVMYA
ncbi:MAG: ATP synthase F1 subunit delta [bacterium]|nr:ATP synthase F1 subunit delta [Candidatus Sumerlaeota bacterium]